MIRLKTVEGTTPQMLLDAIYEGIAKKEREKGKIATWSKDANGYLRHTTAPANQWKELAWLIPQMPEKIEDELRFTIGFPKAKSMIFSKADMLSGEVKLEPSRQVVYATYHGRFLEMLMSHFSELFTITKVTARPFVIKKKG